MATEGIALTINVDITDQIIADLLCSMFEGGSNYWIDYIDIKHPYGQKPNGVPNSTWAASAINNGGTALVYVVNDGRHVSFPTLEHIGERVTPRLLNKDRLLTGFKEFLNSHPQGIDIVYENGRPTLDICNIDASDADQILQLALFREVVFG